MSDSSPLIPQGSLLEQQAKGRPHLRIALCIVAVHLVFLGGLLMQGCKREDPSELADTGDLPLFSYTNTVQTLPPQPIPSTNPPTFSELPTSIVDQIPVASNTPSADLESLLRPADSVTELAPALPTGMTEYVVVRNDTFFGLARRFNVTAAAIAQANPGVDPGRLQVGETLMIPPPMPGGQLAAGSGGRTTSSREDSAGSAGIYTVKGGDTLTRIAGQNGTTVRALKDLNGLVTDRIIVGQKLKLPETGARTNRAVN